MNNWVVVYLLVLLYLWGRRGFVRKIKLFEEKILEINDVMWQGKYYFVIG